MVRNAYPSFYKGRPLSLSSRGGCRCRSLEPGGRAVRESRGSQCVRDCHGRQQPRELLWGRGPGCGLQLNVFWVVLLEASSHGVQFQVQSVKDRLRGGHRDVDLQSSSGEGTSSVRAYDYFDISASLARGPT